MTFLSRPLDRPDHSQLTAHEQKQLAKRFILFEEGVRAEGQAVPWAQVNAVELVKAARLSGLGGWLARGAMGEDRYHVGLYFGEGQEAVLPNISLNLARYILLEVAYHAPKRLTYSGIADVLPLEGE
jgi:hypothetical protein